MTVTKTLRFHDFCGHNSTPHYDRRSRAPLPLPRQDPITRWPAPSQRQAVPTRPQRTDRLPARPGEPELRRPELGHCLSHFVLTSHAPQWLIGLSLDMAALARTEARDQRRYGAINATVPSVGGTCRSQIPATVCQGLDGRLSLAAVVSAHGLAAFLRPGLYLLPSI